MKQTLVHTFHVTANHFGNELGYVSTLKTVRTYQEREFSSLVKKFHHVFLFKAGSCEVTDTKAAGPSQLDTYTTNSSGFTPKGASRRPGTSCTGRAMASASLGCCLSVAA